MKQFKRSQRLGQQLRRDISILMEQELTDLGRGMLTFTQVHLSDDLRYAKMFYSFLGSDEDRTHVAGYLEREKRRIRSQLGRGMRIRHIPEIEFKFDPSVEYGMKIEQLLNEIGRDNNPQ